MTRRRSILVWTLVVVATVLALVSSMTVWSKRQLLSTDQWTKSSAKLLADDQVRAVLSSRLADLLYQRVDLKTQLEEQLPPQAKGAAPVAAAAIQGASARVIDAFLGSAAAQTLWEQANRRAHTALVQVLEGNEDGRITTAGGDVVIDLRPLLERIATRLGVEDRLKANADPTTGQIVIMHSDQLDAAQRAVRILKALSVWLALLTLALYVLAVYLARGRRRRILGASGVSLVLVGLILLIVRRVAGDLIVDSLVKVDASRPAVRTVWVIETDLLKDLALALIVYGLGAIIAVILSGPNRLATAVRRSLAPTFSHSPVAVYGVALLLFLLVVGLGPGGGSRRLLGVVILAGLTALGIEIWRRQILREFPQPAAVAKPEPPAAT